jgi:hypothetical protein
MADNTIEEQKDTPRWIKWKNIFCDFMINLCDGILIALIVVFTLLVILWLIGVRW